jgi:hypothetical protein
MLNFYEVINKGRGAKAYWIIAKDEEEAKKIASTQNGAPIKVNEMIPVDNISKLLLGEKTGIIGKKLIGLKLSEIFLPPEKQQKQPEDPWFFLDDQKF